MRRGKKGPQPLLSAVPGVPNFPLFGVVVGHIPDAFQLHEVHDFLPCLFRRPSLFAPGSRGVFVPHDGAMHRRMTPPTERNKIHGMVCTAMTTGLDVVNLQALCAVTDRTPEAVPFVYLPSYLLCDSCRHFWHRPFCRLSRGIFHGAHEGKANVTAGHASAHTGSLAPCGTMGEPRKAARTGYERHSYMIAQTFDEYKKLVRLYWNVSSFLVHHLVFPSRREYHIMLLV